MRASASSVRVSSARASMPMAPCPTAGKNSSALMTAVACCVRPSRRKPASASSVASTSPASSFASRVSTLPRSGTTERSGRSRLAIAWRRSDAVPSTAPCGRSRKVFALRLMKASRASSRSRHAASINPGCDTVGMSFDECTARSTRRSSSASSISLVNRPLPPTSDNGRSWILSPEVRMITSSTASSASPKATASRARTVRACTSASGLPRVPRRSRTVDCAMEPLDVRAPFRPPLARKGEAPPLRREVAGAVRDKEPMLVLGIETTCDETAAAVVERTDEGAGRILSNIVLSQNDEHADFGGVVPEIAARAHVEVIDRIVAQAMREADVRFADLDGVAAAAGPGLIGGVIVGLTTAKAIALVENKPLMAVNHLEAHALTARLTDKIDFPYCLFLASGGHTQVLAVRGVGDYVRLGTTMDDAIGEAFDKTAKLLGLGYPGGPQVEQEARAGNPQRFALPRPMQHRKEADFSFSGLKTALRLEAEAVAPLSNEDVADPCASFQQAV